MTDTLYAVHRPSKKAVVIGKKFENWSMPSSFDGLQDLLSNGGIDYYLAFESQDGFTILSYDPLMVEIADPGEEDMM